MKTDESPAAVGQERLDRIEKAITTLAWWLVEAQTGFAERDARGIDRILSGETVVADLTDVELWINRGRFAGHGVKAEMTGAELRYLPSPPISHNDDLYLEVPGGDDLAVSLFETIDVRGRRFYSVPKVINAG